MQEDGIKITRNLDRPEIPGEYFRIVCMTGKNKGLVYFISAKRLVLGRGDIADIQVLDSKASREHAELVKHKDGYILTDLGSQNGIWVNDFKIKQHPLIDGDKIIIGQSVLMFNKITVEQKKDLIEVEDQEEDIDQNIQDKKEKPKKNIILLLAPLVLVYLFMSGESENQTGKKESRSIAKSGIEDRLEDLIKQQTHKLNKDTREKVAEYIHRGQREFREGNFFRAIEEFNLALILVPNHGDAAFYLNKTKQSLDRHVKRMSGKGAREYGQLKYDAAVKSYCEVLKLLQKYPDDERYKEAENQVDLISQKMGMEKGQYQCWGVEREN